MKIQEQFLNLENRLSMLEIEVLGYKYWAYHREFVYNCYVQKLNKHSDAHEKLPAYKQIIRYLSNLTSCIRRKRIFNKKFREPITLVLAHPRRQFLDGEYYSIYSDLVIPYDENIITLENSFLYSHSNPTPSKNLVFLDDIELISKIKYLWSVLFSSNNHRRLKEEIRLSVTPFIEELNRLLNTDVSVTRVVNTCAKHYYLINETNKYWDKHLSKLPICRIVEVIGYSITAFSLNNWARLKGIPTIELQHGMLSHIHIAYQYNAESKLQYTPDYIFTFSDEWSKLINMPGTTLRSIGFEFFNQERIKHPIATNRKDIVIISQKNVGNELSQIAIDIANYLSGCKSSRIIYYKLHPSEFVGARLYYPDLFTHHNIRVVKNEMNLYDIFTKCEIQIGYNSTAIFEGLGFNIDTYLLPQEDSLMIKLVNDNIASFYQEPSKVFNSAKLVCNNVSDYFWKPNAKNNFMKEIKDIKKDY